MSDSPSMADSSLPLSLLRQVNQVCEHFEAVWRTGHRPRIADFVSQGPSTARAELFRWLLTLELDYRRRSGEKPALGEYQEWFPEFAAPLRAVFREGQPSESAAALLSTIDQTLSPSNSTPIVIDEKYPILASSRPLREEENRVARVISPPTNPGALPRLGDYELLQELGKGGMGVVYRARQQSLNRTVALKVIRADHCEGLRPDERAKWLDRFRAETEAAARLEHEHIVAVYAAGDIDGQPFYSMRYIEGCSLAKMLDNGPLKNHVAAAYLAPVARAVHYAHSRGILHRDLKPHNILVEKQSDRPFVSDFGLAKLVEGGTGLTLIGDLVGTPSYMSPEQAKNSARVTPATDVYALGATLYHLLTARPPFQGAEVHETLQQVFEGEPIAPRRLNPAIDADLQTIVLKCLEKEPKRRYATAGLLAEDLERYLGREPIQARPLGPVGRLWRWCRRKPMIAGLGAAVIALLLAVIGVLIWLLSITAARNQSLEETARQQRLRDEDQHYEDRLRDLQAIRTNSERTGGWSDHAWQRAVEVAGLRRDERLRDQAAAVLNGLDAHLVKRFEGMSASSVAFDRAGRRLLVGGASDRFDRSTEPARLWDGATDALVLSQRLGPGPVAFRTDGTPLQLVVQDGPALLLWDVEKQRRIGGYKFPELAGTPPKTLEVDTKVLDSDGSLVAAFASDSNGKGILAVWEAGSGKVLFHRSGENLTALAVSSDRDLLAVGDAGGQVTLWALADRRLVATLPSLRTAIRSLAFSSDARLGQASEGGGCPTGRLAAGDAGSTVAIWDLATRLPTYCKGFGFGVYALAFSPDGTLLASGGRYAAKLWDAATGRLILNLPSGDSIRGLAFSPDARQLAVACFTSPFGVGNISVWKLEYGRGILTLLGLVDPVAQICFSPDRRLVAAQDHNWRIGIWEIDRRRLLRVLDGPKGISADNAGLAISPDGRRLAFSTWREAKLWDVPTGRELGSWPLPPGLGDRLAFHPSGKLLLFRVETQGSMLGPVSDVDPHEHPRVCRIRDLLGAEPTKPIAEIKDFNWRVQHAVVSPDGSYFVAEGIHDGPDGQKRVLKVFDGPTGTEQWSIPCQKVEGWANLTLDPSGRLLAINAEDRPGWANLVDVASGKVLEPLSPPKTLGLGARYVGRAGPTTPSGTEQGYSLFHLQDTSPLVVLGIDAGSGTTAVFNRDGTLWAWGNADGTVAVVDIEQVRKRLNEIGLGW